MFLSLLYQDLEDGDEENTTAGSPGKFRGGRKACCFCGKTFCDNYTLRRHMVTHLSRERQFECPMCNAAYSRKDHLMAHIRRKHPIGDDVEKLDFSTGQAS
ncbi:Zinc finger and BTB domain-containing protein 3-like [Homarus americanus]|uniref:Zinc finger and BTB domain-containing protein 3-like n=1 Tax=Homarus americanus TaxID=6706 RepID=A0A8J5N276_HOMAM|nr:Zinc finger and BTB domain-containing protein 3-like [Homarus americanus]